jgi:hypothetical protein
MVREGRVTKMVAGCDVEEGLRTHIDAILTLRHEVENFLSLAQINHLSYTFQSPSRIYFPSSWFCHCFILNTCSPDPHYISCVRNVRNRIAADQQQIRSTARRNYATVM